MRQILALSIPLLVLIQAGCDSQPPPNVVDSSGTVSSGTVSPKVAQSVAPDRTTPQGAILSLEEAYRNQNIEAAVLCKDFGLEAELMLAKLQPALAKDPEILAQTIEMLELGFRKEKEKDFPDFNGVKSSFSQPKPYDGRDDIVELIETCKLPNGQSVENKMFVAKTSDGWKVISVVED